ncbi:MAG TPA: nuclear transport factor 2 family protein [Gammaproteobacteria bacterium]|jgi:ketosteroid isomerase-like protein
MRIVPLIASLTLLSTQAFAAGSAPASTSKAAPAAATQTAAAGAKSDEEQLKDLEQQWLDAALKHDNPWLEALIMDDFQDVSWQGQLRSKADVLAAGAVPVTTTQTLSDLKVRVHGDLGVVTGINTTEAADKSFTVKVRFTDVFVKSGDRWRALSAQETIQKGG